jgi:hypothetical protein
MLTDKLDLYCDICRWCKITLPSEEKQVENLLNQSFSQRNSKRMGYEKVKVEGYQDCRIRSSDGKEIH